MWTLLKTEFTYHRKIFLGFLAVLPLFWANAFTSLFEDVPQALWMFFIILMVLQIWNAFRNKEHRDRRYMLLPVSARGIAFTRILLTLLSGLGYILFYALGLKLFHPQEPISGASLLKICAILFAGFAVYFVIRDLFLPFFRAIGLTQKKIILGATLIALGLNILGILMLLRFEKTGSFPLPLKPLLNFIIRENPFAGEYGPGYFTVLCLAIISLTLFSFAHRKSYLE